MASFITYPASATTVYNPIGVVFSSSTYSQPGYRYILNIYNGRTITSTNKIASLSVAPTSDGRGYTDISFLLKNYVGADVFNNSYTTTNPLVTQYTYFPANNAYIDYCLGLGEEYQLTQTYQTQTSRGSGVYTGYVILSGTSTHPYLVGDQLSITTTPTGNTASINGLHTVVEVLNNKSYVINTLYVGTATTANSSGTTVYADGRKTRNENQQTSSFYVGWDGAFSFNDYPSQYYGNQIVQTSNTVNLQTGLQPQTYLTQGYNSDLWFLFINKDKNAAYKVIFTNDRGDEYYYRLSGLTNTSAYWIYCGTDQLNSVVTPTIPTVLPLIDSDIKEFTVSIVDSSNNHLTTDYWIKLKDNCEISTYQILFKDRLGSFATYDFPLRVKENIQVSKEKYNNVVSELTSNNQYIYSQYYKNTETIIRTDITRELLLNTNWMTEADNIYFEQLITSPTTYYKINHIDWYPCIIEETGYEIVKQRNQNLIRKTIKVKINSDIINAG